MSKVTDVSVEVLHKAIKLDDVRASLLAEYNSKINALTKEDWESIKALPKFVFRKFSVIDLVPKFRFASPIQKVDSEEESKLTFIDVQRILCYLLLGNDFIGKWASTTEAGFGEPLYKEITEKIKEVAKANDYDVYSAYFVVEKMAQKGDYALKIVKRREDGADEESADIKDVKAFKTSKDAKPARAAAGGGGGGPKTYATVVAKKEHKASDDVPKETKPLKGHTPSKTNVSAVPTGPCIETETMDPMLAALDAMAKLRNKKLTSNGERTMMAIKLCQMAANLLDGKA
jgi:hypothetical protein